MRGRACIPAWQASHPRPAVKLGHAALTRRYDDEIVISGVIDSAAVRPCSDDHRAIGVHLVILEPLRVSSRK